MLDPVSEDYYLISTDFDTASEAPYPKSIDFHPRSEDYYVELTDLGGFDTASEIGRLLPEFDRL